MPFALDPDYIDVAQRKRIFFDKYPTGSLRGSYDVLMVDGHAFIAYTCECFRAPDDPLPGIGTAWEPVPGRTPYTRDSELQNAETSAWGRAIQAVGAADSKHIASADEIRNRQGAPEGLCDECNMRNGLHKPTCSMRTKEDLGASDEASATAGRAQPSGEAGTPAPVSPQPLEPTGPNPMVSERRDGARDRDIIPAAPETSKARRDRAKARCVALQADGISIADEREARGLPLVDSCNKEQLTLFEVMLTELEGRLAAPFVESTA